MSKCIKTDNGIYVELPRDKIKFESKEAELIYDLSLENDEIQQENQQLKEKINLRNKEKTDICNKLVNYREKIKRLKKEITNLISINKQSKAELKRCVKANVILDDENTELTEKLSVVNQMNETNYNNYCKELKVNAKLKEEIKAYQTMYFDKVMIINKAIELLQLLHYQFPDYDDMHKRIEDIEKILKEDNKEVHNENSK